MKKLMLATVAIAGLVGGASAHDRHSHSHSHGHDHSHRLQASAGTSIIVSCYRGPKKLVYWDRANPEFYDSLRAAGFSAPTAHAIGNRICRDQSLVDNLEAMKDEVRRVIRSTRKDG